MPKTLAGLDSSILDPRSSYEDPAEWEKRARHLGGLRWPKYNYNLSKFIQNANESYEIVLSQTEKDFNSVSSDKKNKIVLSKLISFPKNKQKNIIIYWIDSLGLNIPNTKILNEIVEKFVFALKDKNPKFIWGTSEKEGSVCLKIKKDFLIAQSIT